MSPTVHAFDWPDRFVVGTLGEPGQRTFFLQVRTGPEILSVSLEKQQAAALADRIDEVLDTLMAEEGNPFSVPSGTPAELDDVDPLDEPVLDLFRAGTMSLGWDPATSQIVIEAFAIAEIALDDIVPEFDETIVEIELEPDEMLRVKIPVGSARAFAKRARDIVGAGRPVCSLCGEPMEDDHVCELPDGFQ
ncbi:MAG: DUF3090 domain-containing protein [Aeromicrobium sp.]|uniref:DUF3090 domain-containing protein n=1 Tax=Aeromicrobium sp. TaxID=1871063 RepID=UPI0025C20A62|nr:DUF3090 domain-containing protein [Aeromicrobium sp.]MCK5891870.1 DUF3090 domain-containing protein [Aeromicrobium sp.]MDF1703910.1 DUF3090 domain-containing protein [Aeromicrobium sp.]